MGNDEKRLPLQVYVELVADASETARPKLAAYAFSAGGALLDRGGIDAKGNATLGIPATEVPTAVRVLVGPELEKPDLGELVRRAAREVHLRLSPRDQSLTAKLTILPPDWLCWLRSACFVKGTLIKRVTNDGVSLDLPVCHATVDVFEVDPLRLIIPKIPVEILERIRELIVAPVPPLPEPLPDPAALQPLALQRSPRPARVDGHVLLQLREAEAAAPLRATAHSGNLGQFRDALLDSPVLVRPLLCAFFPQLVTMQRVATAVTDECGHFQTLFFRGCRNPDQPDLYFRARQRLFGLLDITIYAPTPISCHTRWNYQCGSEITLVTTHPLAITCSPCPPVIGPNNWVLFSAIGNHSLRGIYGGGAPGATTSNWGLTDGNAPWGGVLRPRLDFDNSLRENLGVKFYQLSWRAGTSGTFAPLTAPVFRHFAHMVGSDLVIEPYALGPNFMTVEGENRALFEIPPAVPPLGQWTVADALRDTQNGEFPSEVHSPGLQYHEDGTPIAGTSDGSGLFQLKLDLYAADGTRIHVDDLNIHYLVPSNTDLSGVIETEEAAAIGQPGGGFLKNGDSMILTLHVDNNRCWAGLAAPSTPNGTADACCGVVRYSAGASVSMPYTAFHPHGFASHSLRIYRSATQIMPNIEGGVGNFIVNETVANMMSLQLPASCAGAEPCTTAAFAENLRVHAKATDGWSTLIGYGDDDNRAFALSPAATP